MLQWFQSNISPLFFVPTHKGKVSFPSPSVCTGTKLTQCAILLCVHAKTIRFFNDGSVVSFETNKNRKKHHLACQNLSVEPKKEMQIVFRAAIKTLQTAFNHRLIKTGWVLVANSVIMSSFILPLLIVAHSNKNIGDL